MTTTTREAVDIEWLRQAAQSRAFGPTTHMLLQPYVEEIERLRSDCDALAAEVEGLRRDAGKLPKEPPRGLLISMAIRADHGLGVPGHYDGPMFGGPGTHTLRLAAAIRDARKQYEEVSGYGFWSPGNDCEYTAIEAALAPSRGEEEQLPVVRCPKCKAEQVDHDGFGFIACIPGCGYCTHPSCDGDPPVCGICGVKP